MGVFFTDRQIKRTCALWSVILMMSGGVRQSSSETVFRMRFRVELLMIVYKYGQCGINYFFRCVCLGDYHAQNSGLVIYWQVS